MAARRRLTDSEVMHIRWEREKAMRELGAFDVIVPPGHPAAMTALARRYRVSTSTISDIITRRFYKDV